MKKKFEYKESRGLPGGPNEMFSYITGVFSMEGYKRNSPDVNKPFNIIPSSNITMEGVDFPVRGYGNNGIVQDMKPGGNYNYGDADYVFEVPMAQTGIEVPKRIGVRKNSDGSESTHLMATETLDGKNWFSFPTLFQDPDGTWIDMSNKPWKEAYEEAKRRGELIDFGTDKETAIKFGEGSWKPKMKRGGGLLTKTMKCNSCGWSWKAADGGNDVSTCHKCGGEALPTAQNGREQATISQYEEPAWYEKAADYLASPMTALSYIVQGKDLPDRLPINAENRNTYDMVIDMINPAAWYAYAESADRNIAEGNYTDAAFDALGAIPVVPAWLAQGKNATKAGKNVIKNAAKYTDEVLASSDDIAKATVRDVKPRAKNLDAVTEVNPLSQSQAQNLAEQGRNAEIFKAFEEGANTIDDFVKSYTGDLSSPEGFKRLVQQEGDYLRSIGFDEARIATQAEINAGARLNEIINIGNRNKAIVQGEKSAKNIVKNPYNFNNASYRANTSGDYFDDLFYKPGTEVDVFNLNKTKVGSKILPGETNLGTMFNNSKAVAAHEIGGHGLQSGRKLPVDSRLKKLEPLDEMNEGIAQAYRYFMQGSKGKEPSAYLHELRQAMLDNKLIRNRYDYVSPEQLKRYQTLFDLRPSGTVNTMGNKFHSNTRILDFMKPTQSNFNLLARELNKLPAMVPVGVAGAAGASALSQEKYGGSLSKAQEGGEYKVKSGDTFYGIANKNDVPWEALKEANPGLDYENLKLDQSIVIPKRINRSPGTPKTKITSNTSTGLNDDLFIKQAYAESSFNPTRKSGAGAKGLTQFTDITIKELKRLKLIDDAFDINDNAQAVKAQKLYMDNLYNRPWINKSNQTDDVRLAKTLAAYNWGPDNAFDYLTSQKKKGVDIYQSMDWIENLPKETKEYIEMILLNKNSSGRPQFQDNFKKALTDDKYKDIRSLYNYQVGGEYSVESGDTLSRIARKNNTSVNELVSLNNIADPNFIKIGQKLILPQQQIQSKPADLPTEEKENKNVYRVKSGDTLGKIAKQYGTSVNTLTSINNIKDPNLIIVNQELQLPQNYREEKPLAKEEWVSTKKLEKDRRSLNQMADEDIITKSQLLNNPNQQYVVVDKKNQRLKLYQGSDVLMDFEVNTGVNPGDAQTATKAIDVNKDGIITDADRINGQFEVDWSKGNLSTGAGRYEISSTSPTSKAYYNNAPSFIFTNEAGQEVSTAIHGAPDYRLNYFDNESLDDNRSSNGCVNGKCSDLQALYNMNLPKGTPMYILPEDDGNYFEMVDGKAVLRMSSENRKKYLNYTDERGRQQKGQGGNYTINTLNYKPIRAKFDEAEFKDKVFTALDFNDEEEYENTTKPFIKALEENKKDIMQVAQIPGDVYNQIARMSFGIYGTESNYGDTHSTVGNFGRAINKFMDSEGSSSPDVVSKYDTYGADESYRSVGYTQMRWSFLNDREKDALESLGITSNKDLLDPEKSAIATATVLGIRYNEQLTSDQKKDLWNNLPSKWNKRSNYTDRVKRNSRFLDFEQFDRTLPTNKDGGEISDLEMYKNYVYGKYDGTEMETKAKKLYDKLNRVYYKEAKEQGTSVPNYIISKVMKQVDN
jgi:LysM repeat protein